MLEIRIKTYYIGFMTRSLDLVDMSLIARLATDIAKRETAAAQVAIFWTVRNCLEGARHEMSATTDAVVKVCDALRADAGHAYRQPVRIAASPFNSRAYCRSFAILCRVIGADFPDPSDGAVRLHRHDAAPRWAHDLEPSALIGSYFFYNDRSLHGHWDCAQR